jgi:hypothetical protein
MVSRDGMDEDFAVGRGVEELEGEVSDEAAPCSCGA